MSAGPGLQPNAVCRPDGGAGGGARLLAVALVPGRAGAGPGGGAVHRHHLHSEGLRRECAALTAATSPGPLIWNCCG